MDDAFEFVNAPPLAQLLVVGSAGSYERRIQDESQQQEETDQQQRFDIALCRRWRHGTFEITLEVRFNASTAVLNTVIPLIDEHRPCSTLFVN